MEESVRALAGTEEVGLTSLGGPNLPLSPCWPGWRAPMEEGASGAGPGRVLLASGNLKSLSS